MAAIGREAARERSAPLRSSLPFSSKNPRIAGLVLQTPGKIPSDYRVEGRNWSVSSSNPGEMLLYEDNLSGRRKKVPRSFFRKPFRGKSMLEKKNARMDFCRMPTGYHQCRRVSVPKISSSGRRILNYVEWRKCCYMRKPYEGFAINQPSHRAIEIDRSMAEPADSEGNLDLRAASLEGRSQELQVH